MTSSIYCSFYDPERSSEQLVASIEEALAGTLLTAATTHAVPSRQPGGLAELRFPFSDLAPVLQPFGVLGGELAKVVAQVAPKIAVTGIDEPADDLADPDWGVGQTLLRTGWVRLDALDARQREAFDDLLRERLARPLGSGATWGPGRWWSLTKEWIRNPDDLVTSIYTAWTGRAAGPLTPPPDYSGAPDPDDLEGDDLSDDDLSDDDLVELSDAADLESSDEGRTQHDGDSEHDDDTDDGDTEDDDEHATMGDLNPPELWFWHHDLDEDELVARIARALPTYDVWYDDYKGPRWRPIVATPPEDRTDQPTLLADLRDAVLSVGADWAALQAQGGFEVPGLDMDVPAVGILDHPWVSAGWIGESLADLHEALDGAATEQVGQGVLFLTASDPRDPAAPSVAAWTTREERFAAVSSAARILGVVARDSVEGRW